MWCNVLWEFQLEAKKNTLENVLNNNLMRKRDELKQVRGNACNFVFIYIMDENIFHSDELKNALFSQHGAEKG